MNGYISRWFTRAACLPLLILIAVLMIVQSADARVRREHRRRVRPVFCHEGPAFSISVGRMGLDTELPGLDTRDGRPGLVLCLSYGLSDKVVLFGSLTGSGPYSDEADDWSAGYADLGLKFSLVSGRRQRTQPYLSVSLGAAVLDNAFDDGREYTGGSARLAGGIDHFITPRTLLFAEIAGRGGGYKRVHFDGRTQRLTDESEFSSVELLIGLRFRL